MGNFSLRRFASVSPAEPCRVRRPP